MSDAVSYGTVVALEGATMDEAVEKVTAALKEEGFGVLTEIDVKATFKKKLDLDHPPYRILGACNPKLASRALAVSPMVGLLLPCNVVVREVEGGVEVALVKADAMFTVVGDESLADVVTEVQQRLDRVAAALA